MASISPLAKQVCDQCWQINAAIWRAVAHWLSVRFTEKARRNARHAYAARRLLLRGAAAWYSVEGGVYVDGLVAGDL